MKASWYLNRLATMSPREVIDRVADQLRKYQWRRRQLATVGRLPVLSSDPVFLSSVNLSGLVVSDEARASLLRSADGVLGGSWPVFAHNWDTGKMDWFGDPKTGRRAPQHAYAFAINHRDESVVGNIKYVWEPSRHHMVTVLAMAHLLSGDDRYAKKALELLHSWWNSNPFLSGVHWTSGIEVGLRLVSWVWARRLLDGFIDIEDHFERNPAFLEQVLHHQEYLASFPSRGTSANNHIVVEMAGLYAAAAALPWFPESSRWRSMAKAVLIREMRLQIGGDGINRELATSYHAFVSEFFLWAMVEGHLARDPFPPEAWETLRRTFDAAAAIVDSEFEPPRQGDDDDAQSLLLDGTEFRRWESLLHTGHALFGAQSWWPEPREGGVRSAVVSAIGLKIPAMPTNRPADRSTTFSEAGLTVFRADFGGQELWCRFDHGPHGYLAIAGHAHADALSVELRIGGQPVLIDPGTYCYHGEPEWRRYFRSTAAHNTIEIDGLDQSQSGGPFIWTEHAVTETVAAAGNRVVATQHGYRRLRSPISHRRTVSIDIAGELTIDDELIGNGEAHQIAVSYHLDHDVECRLSGLVAHLLWKGGSAEILLPEGLEWSMSVGSLEPIRGWQSPGFDVRIPTTTLLGVGTPQPRLRTVFRLATVESGEDRAMSSAREGVVR